MTGDGAAWAQIDPEPRANIELGIEGPLKGHGATSGYAFLLWNRPHLLDEDLYFRVVSAPTYLTSELVRDRWPAPGHALGLGFGGGLFPYDFNEFRNGDHKDGESFYGHGADVSLSYYRRLKIADVLPVEGQLRFRPQYVIYERTSDTSGRFRLPSDSLVYNGRAGVRIGGEPPELFPDLALELSVWYEASYRESAAAYGFAADPIRTEHLGQQLWGRAGSIFTVTRTQTIRAFLTAGAGADLDALTSYRLGSALPFRREFPLVLHGYYVDEIFARRFWLVNLAHRFPLWPDGDRVRLQLSFDYAQVDYLPRHVLPRSTLRGVGADLTISVRSGITLVLGYGYGIDAPRNSGFGGHEANVLLEFKL